MADLRKHIAPDARTGGSFDVYVASIKVGYGRFLKVEPLHVSIEGEAGIPGIPVKGSVEIIMPDTSPSGTCTVVVNGGRHDGCRYQTSGIALEIDAAGESITLQGNDRSYSWVRARGIWAGLWTTSAVMAEADLADAPAGQAEPAAAGD
jgi:hypothetical protein